MYGVYSEWVTKRKHVTLPAYLSSYLSEGWYSWNPPMSLSSSYFFSSDSWMLLGYLPVITYLSQVPSTSASLSVPCSWLCTFFLTHFVHSIYLTYYGDTKHTYIYNLLVLPHRLWFTRPMRLEWILYDWFYLLTYLLVVYSVSPIVQFCQIYRKNQVAACPQNWLSSSM